MIEAKKHHLKQTTVFDLQPTYIGVIIDPFTVQPVVGGVFFATPSEKNPTASTLWEFSLPLQHWGPGSMEIHGVK